MTTDRTLETNLIAIDEYDRLSGLYVIGATGTGKSTQLLHLILKNIEDEAGVCVLDPHGTMIDALLEHLSDDELDNVILLDLTDQEYVFGLNLFACPDAEQIDEWVAHVLRVFGKVWGVGGVKVTGWGATLEDLLRNIANTMIDNPGMTLTEVPLLLRNEDVRAKLIKNVTNPDVRYYWENDYNKMNQRGQLEDSDSTLNKVRSFLSYRQIRGIVGQSKTTINMREIMDEGKTLLVKLDTRNDDTTTLIGTMLMAEIVSATYSRQSDEPFFIYADEFQRFATSDFARMFAEARKFGVAVTVSHQFRDQLDLENRSATLNAGNLVVFRVSGKDAEELSPEFSHMPEPERLDRIEEEVTDMVEEDVKAPTPDPVAYLKHHAHGHPYVDGLIRKSLLPLFNTFTEDKYAYSFFPETPLLFISFTTKQSNYIKAEQVLNRLFIDAMAGTLTHPAKVDRLTEVLILLRGYFRIQSDERDTMYRENEEYRSYMGYLLELGDYIHPVADFAIKNWERAYGEGATQQKGSRNNLWSPTFDDKQTIEVRREIWRHVLKAKEFFCSLYELVYYLEINPLLVSTGQRKSVPRKRTQVHYVQHPQRPYSDTKNQVAEELAKQPNYTARYRTLDGEGILFVDDIDEGDYDGEEQANYVKHAMIAEGVLRRRSDVEEEIKVRHAKLLTPDDNPPDTGKSGAKPKSGPKPDSGISGAKPYP